MGANEDEWVANFGWKCGQIASHYRDDIRYYMIDNEVDRLFGEGPPGCMARPRDAAENPLQRHRRAM